jgi:hypothetical protein
MSRYKGRGAEAVRAVSAIPLKVDMALRLAHR